MGTAVVHRNDLRIDSKTNRGRPFTSDLSGQDFYILFALPATVRWEW